MLENSLDAHCDNNYPDGVNELQLNSWEESSRDLLRTGILRLGKAAHYMASKGEKLKTNEDSEPSANGRAILLQLSRIHIAPISIMLENARQGRKR
jgi:hypothetical protein